MGEHWTRADYGYFKDLLLSEKIPVLQNLPSKAMMMLQVDLQYQPTPSTYRMRAPALASAEAVTTVCGMLSLWHGLGDLGRHDGH